MSTEGLGAVTSVFGAMGGIARAVTPLVQTAVPLVQGVTGAAGSMIAARGIQQEAEYNAGVSELESELTLRRSVRTEQNAQIARNAAATESARALRAGRALTGTQASIIAKSGLEVGGSPYLATMDTIRKSHEDAVMARWKGDVIATGLEDQATQERVKAQMLLGNAQMLRARGRRAILAGTMGATSAGLQAAKTGLEIASLMPRPTPARQMDYLAGTGTAGGAYIPIESPEYQVGY